LRTVKLYGQLAKKFIDQIDLEVSSAAEAIRALSANYPSFRTFLINSEEMGIRYKVLVGGEAIATANDIRLPASGMIEIIPVMSGAGGPIERILVGAALIAAAVLLAPYTAGSSLAFLPNTIGAIGVSLTLNGVASLLSPAPTQQKPNERPENDPSNYFNGPVNTTLQGQCVPIAYGEIICGSAVISAGISVDQIAAGFKVVLVDTTTDIDAVNLQDGYLVTPPANWFKRDLLSIENTGVTVYHYRFHYYVETLVPI
jgi:predicted phage tail protein